MASLSELISQKYSSAYENKHLLFTHSVAKIVTQNNIQFSIRCAAALQHKTPKQDPKYNDEKPFNPFLPPDPNLKITDMGENHVLVLNKYCILPEHFLLVSKKFESQADDLTREDVSVTLDILQQMNHDGRWLAFYNCGEFSGASQQHKHVQFIPLPPREEFTPFPDLLHQQNQQSNENLPFQHYIASFPPDIPSTTLIDTYNALLTTLRSNNPQPKLSYNFVMTPDWIFVSPREKDDYQHDGHKIGVNSTGMVGLLLTKSDEETAFVEKVGPLAILADVGSPWPNTSPSSR